MLNRDIEFNIKDVMDNLKVMSDEERNDPSLVKKREDFNNTQIAIYYGSAKSELAEACITCKRKNHCIHYFDAKEQNMQLKRSADISEFTEGLSPAEIEKIRNNVYIIVNCIFKEEE